jgi:soluble cytochrome b562
VIVRLSGVGIGCSQIHKSELEKEVKLKRSSRAECEWTMKDWRATMDQIKNRGCWGIKCNDSVRLGGAQLKRRSRTDRASVSLGGVRILCSKIHKSHLAQEVQLKRSSRAECEWTMKDWQATMGQIKNIGCWGVKYQRASPIHKADMAMEIQPKRSNRAECEWTTQDSDAATMLPDAETTLTVVSNKRHCTVPTVESHTDTERGNRAFRVHRGGVRIRCSEIHTSDLEKEIQLKRSTRAECEWTFQDWRAAMDEIKNRGCWSAGA